MGCTRSPLAALGYLLLAVGALVVVVKIVLWAIRVLAVLLAALVTLVLVVAVGWSVYLVLRVLVKASR
ncbi:MAG: hypothetical protein QHI38_08655 [Armatimonadota bacterium]|nr:hypothetical protein [Armatimonadota bacterium]